MWLINENDFETVVLLGDKKVDGHINIDLDVEKPENKGGRATYAEIKAYVKEKYGYSVSSLYIAQPGCPEEKVKAIEVALRHFQMI